MIINTNKKQQNPLQSHFILTLVVFPFFARDPLSQLEFFLRGILQLFFLAVLHFGGIFSYVEKTRFGWDFDFVPSKHHFHQFCPVNIINTKVSIKKDHLHVKAVLQSHHLSVCDQWFGRESRSKPFLRLSFIYIEIAPKSRLFF